MNHPRRLLLALPFLLLVPLGAVKWRADWIQDHPPLSRMERQFRADLSQYPVIYIAGSNRAWQQLTGMPDNRGFMVRAPAALREIGETLRFTDQPQPIRHVPTLLIFLRVPTGTPARLAAQTYFTYGRHEGGSYYFAQSKKRGWGQRVTVRARFAPRFEALVARLAQQAKAPGTHPGITMSYPPEEPAL